MTPPGESTPVESAYDRRKRREEELKVLEQERMRLHRTKRRRRRELRPPRLSYVESPAGWTLTVPPNPSQVRLFTRIAVVAAAATVAVLLLEASWAGRALYLSLVLLLPLLFATPYLSGFRRTTYADVGRDGQLTVHGRRAGKILFRREVRATTVQVDFNEKTALAEWKLTPGELSFHGFGDRDIQVLKEFCTATRVSFQSSRPEEAEKAAFVPSDERRSQNRALVILFTGLIGLFGGLAVLSAHCHVVDPGADPFVNKSLKGTFHSTNKDLGEWTLTPSACLSGRERGFTGIAFLFPVGGPVEEIHVDTAREGDNVVEVRLADRKGTVARYRERECQTMAGSIEQSNVEMAGRPMVHLKGNTRFSCPAQGLSGDADFDGCLPQ